MINDKRPMIVWKYQGKMYEAIRDKKFDIIDVFSCDFIKDSNLKCKVENPVKVLSALNLGDIISYSRKAGIMGKNTKFRTLL